MPDDTVAGAVTGPPRPTVVWHVLTALWAIPAALMSASVSPHFGLVVAVVFSGGLLGLIWCIQLARVLLDPEARRRLAWRAIGAWAFCPATGLLLTALYFTQWPLVLRVKLSEPALLRLVTDIEADRVQVDRPIRAGLMSMHRAAVEEHYVLLYTDHGFIFTEYGLAYSRDGNRPTSSYWGLTFRHLFGRWYIFEERD